MFVDAYYDARKNRVLVSERNNGERIEKQITPSYYFYEENKNGTYLSTTGAKCKRLDFASHGDMKKELETRKNQNIKTFESDIKPLFKTLEEHYQNDKIEKLHISFWDIETDYDPIRGFSSPTDALNQITAISVHNSWEDTLYTLLLQPDSLTWDEASKIAEDFDNTILCKDEKELLKRFLDLIEDADILSGWNSAWYDLPYCINRTRILLGDDYVRKYCLWQQLPTKKEFEKFGEMAQEYTLIGRVHLDYMDLFKKYSYHSLPSYRLGYVGKIVTGETKVEYEGALADLFRGDFKTFIQYSRQDVALLDKMDKKLDYVSFVNLIAHESIVPIPTVLGTIALTDNAILLEAHGRGMVVPDRESTGEGAGIAGAFVMEPEPGIATDIMIMDINSLYPSTFRTLNMSPETIVGQIRQTITKPYLEERAKKCKDENIWSGIFEVFEAAEVIKKSSKILTVDFETGDSFEGEAKVIWDMIQNNNWMLSANGTIFTTEKEGIVPSLLARWYKTRKENQAIAKDFKKLIKGIKLEEDLLREMENGL